VAVHLSYYEFDSGIPLECSECGWFGTAAEASTEYFDALFDVSCPKCDKMLLIVSYATIEETKAAAAARNARALEESEYVARVEDFRARFEREALREIGQLPEVDGDQLRFVWDFSSDEERDERRTIISLDGRVIWDEPALWEGDSRFREVKALLKERYGPRFASLTPTRKSETWLLGDNADMTGIPRDLFADPPDEIARLRREIYCVFFLRATPDGDLSLEREDVRASHHELDGTWFLPAEGQDRLLDALGLERPPVALRRWLDEKGVPYEFFSHV
jgi:hypothetical protein